MAATAPTEERLGMAERGDAVAWSFEQAPDEAYLGFSVGAIFSAAGLYLTGHRDEAFIVGVLGPALALTGLAMKILGTTRGTHRTM